MGEGDEDGRGREFVNNGNDRMASMTPRLPLGVCVSLPAGGRKGRGAGGSGDGCCGQALALAHDRFEDVTLVGGRGVPGAADAVAE